MSCNVEDLFRNFVVYFTFCSSILYLSDMETMFYYPHPVGLEHNVDVDEHCVLKGDDFRPTHQLHLIWPNNDVV